MSAEYTALRSHAARFDLSAAGLVEVGGPDAYDLVQGALARDLEFVTPEQSLAGALLDDAGHPVDVVTAYHAASGFRLETSLGLGPAVVTHLESLSERAGLDVTISLLSDLTIILVEGPQAAKILGARIHRDIPAMPLMGVRPAELGGVPVTVVRSGFTGEYGYKLFVAAADFDAAWKALDDLAAAGSDVLETAMLEVRQPITHLEVPGDGDALRLGWAWLVDVTKDEYIGREALMAAFEGGARSEVVGLSVPGSILAPGTPVLLDQEPVGSVLHSVESPAVGAVLALARLEAELIAPGIEFTLPDGRTATSLVAPYVTPASWAR